MKLSVIIPLLNEQDSLRPLYNKLVKSVDFLARTDIEIIFVDDGSRDQSLALLRELSADDARVKVISFKRNFGQTAALSAGIKLAQGDIIVTMDADLQNDPADIHALYDKLGEGFDLISGWRKNRQDSFVVRTLPSWFANKIISWVTGVKLHDYGCTLKAYRKEILDSINLYGEMHRFIPAYAARVGAKITEMPVNHHAREFGQSKYTISRTFRVILDLLTVKFLNDYATKPMHFFGGFGIIFFFLGFLSFAGSLILRFDHIATLIETPLPLLSVFFVLIGFQFILMGLLAEMIMRNYFESHDKSTYIIKETINL